MKSVLIPSFTLLFAFSMLITAVLLYDLEWVIFVNCYRSDVYIKKDFRKKIEIECFFKDYPDETESNGTIWSEMESGEAVNDVDEWTRDFNDGNSQSLNVTLT
ncbi:hypothetical protein ACH3XW_0835 [Acanthocheilonema viteae]